MPGRNLADLHGVQEGPQIATRYLADRRRWQPVLLAFSRGLQPVRPEHDLLGRRQGVIFAVAGYSSEVNASQSKAERTHVRARVAAAQSAICHTAAFLQNSCLTQKQSTHKGAK